MTSPSFIFASLLWAVFACAVPGCNKAPAHNSEPEVLPILEKWSGNYPVAYLDRLPKGQRSSRVGYLGNAKKFAEVWQAFKPGEKLPKVDFRKHLVVFSRNVDFYNRISIAKITLKDGTAEVISIETRSAMPIDDKVAMAMAVLPRIGVKFVGGGKKLIPVVNEDGVGTDRNAAADPLQAAYLIEGQVVRLVDGRSEVEAAPGSATKIKTSVFGKPVYGDLDGDGDDDVALLLVQDPGGSGTFYYLTGALKVTGGYRGTNAVLLGDRIGPQPVEIRNGVVISNYTVRRADEPMAAVPTVGKSKHLIYEQGELIDIRPLEEGEQIVEGWVAIGHEVRSFFPCSGKTDLWLLGNSPALNAIIKAHRQALPDRTRYAPLFMVLAGKFAARSTDGHGGDYKAAFFATQLVRVWPVGNCKSGYIVVDSPAPGETVASPLRVRGRARGTWFFEGDFPIALRDASGKSIATGYVTAKGNWMTQEFVPFQGTLEFKKSSSWGRGTLIFKKDNPTGLRKHDDSLQIPVSFE